MQVSGKFVDVNTGEPIGGVVMDLWATGDMSGTPMESQQANNDGTYNFSSSVLDSSSSVISVSPVGYNQMVGQPGAFQQITQLYPTGITQIIKSIPWWAWALIVVVVLGIIHFKFKKLF